MSNTLQEHFCTSDNPRPEATIHPDKQLKETEVYKAPNGKLYITDIYFCKHCSQELRDSHNDYF